MMKPWYNINGTRIRGDAIMMIGALEGGGGHLGFDMILDRSSRVRVETGPSFDENDVRRAHERLARDTEEGYVGK